ncbi:MAG: pyridoxal phosphate-dependent aminotransferase [Saprospiraceae bacterium]|nr:pyridoxal phosphate-dependent aminotransferase [Saprospiraceae bacterium]
MSDPRLTRRVNEMEESATIKMTQMARDLAAKGHNVISLSIGEPDFDTPDHIKDAAIEALKRGDTKYTPVPGTVPLRKAIVEKFKRDNNLIFDESQIVVSNGAKQSIANVVLALVEEGDEVILFAPYWVSYKEIVKLAGGTPIEVKADINQNFIITPDQLSKALTNRTKLIIFSSPCNPTGSVYTRTDLQALAEILVNYPNVVVLSDEIYEYINFTHQHDSIGTFDSVRDRTVTVNGFSKGFAMTGWRLGYMGAPKWIAAACNKIQGQFTSGAASFNQAAAAHALNSNLDSTNAMRAAFQERRDIFVGLLSEIPGFKVNKPTGAFYVFPDISHYFGKSANGNLISNADDLALYILEEGHVAVVSGSAFGADECIRLSYAASEESLREAVKRIKEAVSKLN